MSPKRSECEESEYPFFEGDGSSSNEWRDYGMAGDGYKGPPVFDDDQYEEEIVSGDVGKGFVDNYLNFQEDGNNVSFSGVMLGVEEESMPVYDTNIEDVIEEEEGFFWKRGLDGEEDNVEDVVVVANDLYGTRTAPAAPKNLNLQTSNACTTAADTMETSNVKKAMSDAGWIEAMQDELLQFKCLNVWELVTYLDNIKALSLKWLFKNKLDEEGTVNQNKARLVLRGYRQEEGIDFE
ncbi:uncharacterized mitochondrial protein-like protein [Tanacetum coccineum]